jgi:hypothetical protein
MIVEGGVCTTGCDERELCVGVHSAYYLRAVGNTDDGRGNDSCGEVQRRGDGEQNGASPCTVQYKRRLIGAAAMAT